jgi:indole-3-glycerol phosphate synthase
VDILSEIIAAKRQRVSAAKQASTQEQLREQALTMRSNAIPHALTSALNESGRLNIIAEFKRRSPSKGVIRADADPVNIALEYERGGAIAISVLTEEDYFAGSLDDFRAVRRCVALPILRKDFIFDEYQVWESAAAGADALLLIVAALSDSDLRTLREITEDELGMDALVEVHTRDELRRALAAGAKLIGINNRNLHTFEVSLETSVALAQEVPEDVLLVSESGLHSAEDLHRLAVCGFKAFLIGETLMRAPEPEIVLRALLSESSGQ